MAELGGALDYRSAGVDREAADRLVERIGALTRKTLDRRVKSSIGGYASLFELDSKRWLAASTDGVGTKLKLAFRLGIHHTVGVDLVAMSVNDLLCVGAQPLFFLDYFATGKLNSGIAEQVIAGIVEGCSHAQCALVGGETAEMPDFYAPGEYDLGGFAVGLVDRAKVLPQGQPGSSKAGKAPSPGDVLIGVGSSGFHSNGYSLIRKWIPKGPEGDSLAREFLTPTRIYVKSAMPLIRERKVKALAHITGSGFLNVPRMSSKVSYRIELPELSQVAPIFSKVLPQSGLPLQELAQTFNLGVGLVAIVAAKDAERVVARLCKAGEKAWILGEVIKRPRGKNCEVHVSSPSLGEPAVLVYE